MSLAALPTFYSCSSASESDLASLVASGERSSVTISYRYEVDTSSSSVAAAVDRVQATILAKVAEASGLGGCPVDAPSVDSAEGDRRRRSLLRGGRRILVAPWEGGRGSNSLVALSSSPPDAVAGVPCRSDALAAAASPRTYEGDEEGAALEEISRHASGGVVYGEELSEGSPDDAVELILSSTKVDGTVVARKSVPISPPPVVSEGGRDDADGNEDVLRDLALPFGFASTQSLPKETNSHTDGNPRVVPAAFQKSFPLRTMPEGTLEQLPDSPNSPLSSTNIVPLPKPTRMAGRCTVIQGRTTAYSTAVDDPFENLEGRILALIEHEIVHNPSSFKDDLITDIRMYDATPVDVPDPVQASPGYVTAIHTGLPDEEGRSVGSESAAAFDFTGPMAILVSLVCALIVLAALFAQTSRFRKDDEEGKRSRTRSPASWGTSAGRSGTARDEEVEVDATRSRKKLRWMEEAREEEERRCAPHEPHRYSDDPECQLERSADARGSESFAWNPANAEAAAAAILSTLSFGSARREALAAADGRKDPEAARREAEATGAGEVLGDLRAAERERTPSRNPGGSPRKSPRGSSRRVRSANAAGYERQPTSGSVANDGRGGVQFSKSMGGWLDARPRAASPEESVELDVRSVYDCDADPAEGAVAAGAAGGKARGAGKALADPDDYVSGDATGADNFAADAGGPMPVVTESPARTFPPGKKRSFLGKVFRGRSQQGKEEEEEEERENLALDRMRRNLKGNDTHALADDVTADPRSRAATPVVTPGACQDLQCDFPMPPGLEPPALPVSSDDPMSSSLLQFFTARERRVTPHAEVEAGLCPFDDVSEYSASVSGQDGGQEVESKFFFGNVSAKDDRILLTEDEHDEYKAYRRPKARMVRKFNKMLLQSRGACGAPGRTCDADVKEIHQIYSSDAADEKGSSIPHGGAKVASRRSRASSAGRSRSRSRRRDEGAATPIYMMQRKPSCINPLRPTGFYKSPSALSGKRRKRRGGGDDEGGGEEDHSPRRRGERGVFYAEGGDDEEDEGVPQYVTKTDEGEDGSVALYDPGVLCTGGLGDCWVPVWR